MIILILISQYFHNNMRQVITVFYQDPQLTIFFLSTFNNWLPRFFVEFFWKYCVSSKNFAHSLKKKYMNILSKILAYFAVDNEMKFFLILSISLSSLYFFLSFSFYLQLSPIPREWLCLCVWLRSHPLQKQKLIFTIFLLSFTFTPSPTPRCVTSLLLIYHIFLYNWYYI